MFLPDKWVTGITEIAPCLLAASWMLLFALGRLRPAISFALVAFSAFIAVGMLQLAAGTTVYRWATILAVLYWLGNLSTLFAATQTFADSKLRDFFMRSLVLFGFVIAVIGSLQALTTDAVVYWTFPTKYTGWVVMGPFVYHNQYAAFIELLLPMALYVALKDRIWRWLYLLVSATLYASVFISGSRAGLILTTLEILLVMAMALRTRQIPRGAFWGTGALLAAMILLLGLSAGPDYLLRRFQLKDPYSIRREFLYSSLQMFRRRPIEGVGLGNWSTAYPAYALFDDGLYANQAHNDWVQWAVEGGIPLLLPMLGVAVWVFPRAIRSVWGCGVAAVFLHCFVDYPIQRPAVAVVFFCAMGALPGASAGLIPGAVRPIRRTKPEAR
jgi:O-antigen ligase